MGASLDAVLADTNDGKKFGNTEYASHRILTDEEVARLRFGTYGKAVESITSGRSKTWYLANSDTNPTFP